MVVTFYTHFCSACCATGFSGGCCGVEEDSDRIHNEKACCAHDSKTPVKDCQDFHLSFFKTTGQFTSDKNSDVIKAYQSLNAVITPVFNRSPVEQSKNVLAFNVFHPPPLQADIRITIQSFQI